MAYILGCCRLNILKIVCFQVDDTLECPECIISHHLYYNFPGEHALDSPSTSVSQHHNRATYASGLLFSF